MKLVNNYPVAEPSDFETHDGIVDGKIQVFNLLEDEDGGRAYGYGHISEEDFLAEVAACSLSWPPRAGCSGARVAGARTKLRLTAAVSSRRSTGRT